MDKQTSTPAPRFESNKPVVYRIVVQKYLDASWSKRLAGLRITHRDDGGEDSPSTVLEGLICDQAELSGILNTLYELHFPIQSVVVVKPSGTDGQ